MENIVANSIKQIIVDKAMVQGIVAKRSGFTGQQFSDMLNGRKVIRAEYLPRIAGALGVEVQDLYASGQKGR